MHNTYLNINSSQLNTCKYLLRDSLYVELIIYPNQFILQEEQK
jgi:hypothetical protein